MKLLLTGFDPFGGEQINPSFEAVRRLPDQLDGAQLIKLELPTVFTQSTALLEQALAEHRPDAVLCVGQAGGYSRLAVERVAVNLRDASMADNTGDRPQDQPVIPGAPAAYFATLPVKEIVSALRGAGIPACLSHSAGTYVCNNVMYTLLHRIAEDDLPTLGGFIHVPFTPEQAAAKGTDVASMSLEEITRGLETALRVILAQLAPQTNA